MSNAGSSSTGGIGFFGLLTIVFIVLKLTHQIAWSWFWVFSPAWGGAIVVFLLLALYIWILFRQRPLKS